MKICVYGAGAVGAYIGGLLSLAGEDVTLIARGAHLDAMRENGVLLRPAGGDERVARPRCTGDATEVGAQDYVLVALKAHSAAAVADRMLPLLGPDTAVVPAVNGIPWWYFHKLDGAWRDARLESVDPGGRQWELIGPERVIGCVVYGAAEVVAPGIVTASVGERLALGEPDGSRSARGERLSAALIGAGIRAPLRKDIRDEIWVKLWGNLAFNPMSVLTHATLVVLATDPGTREVARQMMAEAEAVGRRLGVNFKVDLERRIDGTAAVGAHKTSMLQDLERGRPMEIEAILGAVVELGRMTGVATPFMDSVLALTRLRAREAGCYPE